MKVWSHLLNLKGEDGKGGKKGFETGAGDAGFNIYSGVVKNMTVEQGK